MTLFIGLYKKSFNVIAWTLCKVLNISLNILKNIKFKQSVQRVGKLNTKQLILIFFYYKLTDILISFKTHVQTHFQRCLLTSFKNKQTNMLKNLD